SIEQPQNHEGPVAGSEPGKNFNDGVEDDIEHERQSTSVAIGQQTEDECADRTHSETRRQRKRDVWPRVMEVPRDIAQHVGENEEVEGVERPPKEAGDQRV